MDYQLTEKGIQEAKRKRTTAKFEYSSPFHGPPKVTASPTILAVVTDSRTVVGNGLAEHTTEVLGE
jgi:hypothetical protein